MKLTLVLVFIIIATALVQQLEARKRPKRVECYQCEATDPSSDCTKGSVSETCLGKFCYSYTYQEHTKNFLGTTYLKWWWFRGCTNDENACSGDYVSDCTVCSESKCNDDKLAD